eukprot:GDKJ01026345.1.p1 GENE.GDKJ01026345.1~~GDKJ01026345.1.p1  ORF type:complete len:636 (+),score=122.48 GDKJ01026345.1:121-2028(+)
MSSHHLFRSHVIVSPSKEIAREDLEKRNALFFSINHLNEANSLFSDHVTVFKLWKQLERACVIYNDTVTRRDGIDIVSSFKLWDLNLSFPIDELTQKIVAMCNCSYTDGEEPLFIEVSSGLGYWIASCLKRAYHQKNKENVNLFEITGQKLNLPPSSDVFGCGIGLRPDSQSEKWFDSLLNESARFKFASSSSTSESFNVLNPDHISEIETFCFSNGRSGAAFVVGDGGNECPLGLSHQNSSEMFYSRTLVAEILLGLCTLKENGVFCMKIQDSYSLITVSLLWIISKLFNTVEVVSHPYLSPIISCTRYVIARGLKSRSSLDFLTLKAHLTLLHSTSFYHHQNPDTQSLHCAVSEKVVLSDTEFIRSIMTLNINFSRLRLSLLTPLLDEAERKIRMGVCSVNDAFLEEMRSKIENEKKSKQDYSLRSMESFSNNNYFNNNNNTNNAFNNSSSSTHQNTSSSLPLDRCGPNNPIHGPLGFSSRDAYWTPYAELGRGSASFQTENTAARFDNISHNYYSNNNYSRDGRSYGQQGAVASNRLGNYQSNYYKFNSGSNTNYLSSAASAGGGWKQHGSERERDRYDRSANRAINDHTSSNRRNYSSQSNRKWTHQQYNSSQNNNNSEYSSSYGGSYSRH